MALRLLHLEVINRVISCQGLTKDEFKFETDIVISNYLETHVRFCWMKVSYVFRDFPVSK